MITVEQWRERGQTFRFNGHDIFYVREGEGAPLVCIHGFPTASWDFAKLWPELTARFDVVAPDMLGYGLSAKPRGHQYCIAEQVDLHVALLEHLGITECHVLCHDYGDTVGQEWMARHKDGVRSKSDDAAPQLRSVTLLNGGLFPETHRALLIQKLMLSPLGPWVARLSSQRLFDRSLVNVFGPNTPPSRQELDAFWWLATREDGRRTFPGMIRYMVERKEHRERWVGALAQDLPWQVINGSLDPISGAHMVDRLIELYPAANVVRLPHVGHYPHVEDPDAVLQAFLAFVGKHS